MIIFCCWVSQYRWSIYWNDLWCYNATRCRFVSYCTILRNKFWCICYTLSISYLWIISVFIELHRNWFIRYSIKWSICWYCYLIHRSRICCCLSILINIKSKNSKSFSRNTRDIYITFSSWHSTIINSFYSTCFLPTISSWYCSSVTIECNSKCFSITLWLSIIY